jgi:glutathione S-transferase
MSLGPAHDGILTAQATAAQHNIDIHRLMDPTSLAAFPKLSAFLVRFEGLPQLTEYMKSSRFIYWPINNKVAKFGGRGECPRSL